MRWTLALDSVVAMIDVIDTRREEGEVYTSDEITVIV